ncbi:hypothetical protein B9J78_01185 [bacterium Unc6]|nr:hypothetical protein [bacterium Unc6]
MSRICSICGKGPMAGRNIVRKGMAKKKGGVGRRIVRVTKRVFLPNVRKIRVREGSSIKWKYVCSKCLKAGKVEKPIPRQKQEIKKSVV